MASLNADKEGMNPGQARRLRGHFASQQVAALGTIHGSEPFVSMVPYALLPRGQGFVIHVSQLASHTRDMLKNPAVSLLVVAPPAPAEPVQSLARATVQGYAQQCLETSPRYVDAKSVYLARFPESAELFTFSDFSIFVVVPRYVRFIGGFAQAMSITAESFVTIMSAAP